MNYNPLNHSAEFVGLDNYRELLDDPDAVKAFKNTIIFTVVAVALNIVISLTVATLISQMKSNKTRSFFRMIVFLPCMAPMVASAVVWGRSIFNTKIGLVNQIIEAFGGEGVAWTGDPHYVMFSVIVFTLWADLGYNIILYSAGIDGIPGEVYEAAELDHAGGWKKFFHITLPLLGFTRRSTRLMMDALPCGLCYFAAMIFLFIGFSLVDVVFANIIVSSRGIMSVLIGALVSHWGMRHVEPAVRSHVWKRRLVMSVLMVAAMALYSFSN